MSSGTGARGGRAGTEIGGETRLLGVMGWPVAHSLSPAMHNAVLRAAGLAWRYVPLPVHPARVAEAVRGAAALGFQGFNITVPHKQVVIGMLDEVTFEARAVGAVNTVVIRSEADGSSTMVGHNTDVAGFIASLRAGGFDPAGGGRAVVLGAGGAARSVVYGLATMGMDVVVLNRTPERAAALAAELRPALPATAALVTGELAAHTLRDAVQQAMLLVNTTTVGMWPAVDGCPWPTELPLPSGLTVCDLVYNPLETRLLRVARHAGARVIDGLGMLARQGALALSLWLEDPLDIEATTAMMRSVCEDALIRAEGSSNPAKPVDGRRDRN